MHETCKLECHSHYLHSDLSALDLLKKKMKMKLKEKIILGSSDKHSSSFLFSSLKRELQKHLVTFSQRELIMALATLPLSSINAS